MNDDATQGGAPADEGRDPWLREALRHAPDAAERPPDALSARILAEARSIRAAPSGTDASSPSRRRLSSMLAAWWSAAARPSMAGAFATVVVATLVGVLWWERPIEDAMVRSPPAAPAATPVPPTARSTQAQPIAPSSRADATAGSSMPKSEAPHEAERGPDAFPAPAQRERASRSGGSSTPPKVAAPIAQATKPSQTDEAADALRKSEAAPDARSKDAASGGAASPERQIPETRATAPASPAAPAGALTDRLQPRGEDAPRARDRTGRENLAVAPAATSAATSLATLRSRIESDPVRWTWARGGATDAHPAAAITAWLADAEHAAREPADASTAASKDTARNGSEAISGVEVELFHAGLRAATLRVDTTGLEIVDAAGRKQRIALDPATAAALAASLPR